MNVEIKEKLGRRLGESCVQGQGSTSTDQSHENCVELSVLHIIHNSNALRVLNLMEWGWGWEVGTN